MPVAICAYSFLLTVHASCCVFTVRTYSTVCVHSACKLLCSQGLQLNVLQCLQPAAFTMLNGYINMVILIVIILLDGIYASVPAVDCQIVLLKVSEVIAADF
jgi:hypothetical protein